MQWFGKAILGRKKKKKTVNSDYETEGRVIYQRSRKTSVPVP